MTNYMTTKTPIETTQELIAIHTTRMEIVEKYSRKTFSPDAKTRMALAGQQSEKYTKELMIELSKFGDGVMSSVDNQNEYQVIYKNVLGKINTMTIQEAQQTFQSLETALKNIYQAILKTQTDLPVSLREILSKQDNGIMLKMAP